MQAHARSDAALPGPCHATLSLCLRPLFSSSTPALKGSGITSSHQFFHYHPFLPWIEGVCWQPTPCRPGSKGWLGSISAPLTPRRGERCQQVPCSRCIPLLFLPRPAEHRGGMLNPQAAVRKQQGRSYGCGLLSSYCLLPCHGPVLWD